MQLLNDTQKDALRNFIDIVRENNVEIDLPEIAVCGDTSSGKSSLLSALSGVIFPTDAEICTRCPTRVRLELADKLSIKTRILWDPEGAAIRETTAARKSEIDKLKEYQEVKDLEDLTDELVVLQGAVLDYDCCNVSSSNRGISSSTIEVSIKGPDYSNFTITDLPGIVRTVGERESASIISQIDELLEQYLSNPLCIVLAIHPADVDFHNSEIFQRAKKYDPSTKRVMPVITKVDKIAEGEERGVIKLVKNEETSFELGFHLVKLRSQKQVNDNVSVNDVLRNEKNWFKSESVLFNRVDPEAFGVKNLGRRLEKLYINHLSQNIEQVISAIKQKEQDCINNLNRLGPDVSKENNRRQLASRIMRSIHSSIKDLGMATANPPETPRSQIVLSTKRAVLEHLKKVLAIDIVPTEFSDLRPGSQVTKIIDGTAILCKVVACRQEESDAFGDARLKCALVPAIDSNNMSRWPAVVEAALLLKGKSWGVAPKSGFQQFEGNSRIHVNGRLAFVSSDIVTANNNNDTNTTNANNTNNTNNSNNNNNGWSNAHSTTTLKPATGGWGAQKSDNNNTASTTGGFRGIPSSNDNANNNNWHDNKWHELRFFPEDSLFRSTSSLANQIDSRRQRAMPIFEGEAIFKDFIRLWINTQVRDAVNSMISKVENMIRDDGLQYVSEKNFFELGLYSGLRVAIEDALKTSCDVWSDKMKTKIEDFLRQEMEPSTQNHYFTSTIMKLRHEKLRQLITTAAFDTEGKGKCVSLAHVENVFNSVSENKDIIEFVAEDLSISLRAYYKVARKNIVDGISKIIDHALDECSVAFSLGATTTTAAAAASTESSSRTSSSRHYYSDAAAENLQLSKLNSFPEIVEYHLNKIEYNSLLRNQETESKRERAVRAVEGLEKALSRLPELKAKLAM